MRELRPSEKAVLDALKKRAATPVALEDMSGVSNQSVHNALNTLQAAGTVEKVHESGLYQLADGIGGKYDDLDAAVAAALEHVDSDGSGPVISVGSKGALHVVLDYTDGDDAHVITTDAAARHSHSSGSAVDDVRVAGGISQSVVVAGPETVIQIDPVANVAAVVHDTEVAEYYRELWHDGEPFVGDTDRVEPC